MHWANSEQQGWMKTLSSLPPEKKCDCGWDYRGDCMGSCSGKPEKGGFVSCGDKNDGYVCRRKTGHEGPHRGYLNHTSMYRDSSREW